MSSESAKFGVFPGGRPPAQVGGLPSPELQQLWFTIARRRWVSVVLVPADGGASVAEIATSLADVGTRLRDTPVTAIVAESLDFDSARVLSDMHNLITDGRDQQWREPIDVEATIVSFPKELPGAAAAAPVHGALLMPPFGRVIVAVRSVLEQPLGVAVAQAADGVILVVEKGVTRVSSARRTVQLIGPERVLGAFVVA